MAAVCVLIATWSVGSCGALGWCWLPGLTAMGLPVLGLTMMGLAPGWVMTGIPALAAVDGVGRRHRVAAG